MSTKTDPEIYEASAGALAPVIRGIFPHDELADGPYLRSAQAILAAVAGSPHQQSTIAEGLRSLSGLLGGDLKKAASEALEDALQRMEHTEFFQIVLTNSVVTLYSDPEIWQLLGYEGASFDLGGYINRGFNDLSWLPEPRITEYDGEPLADCPAEVQKTTAASTDKHERATK